MQTIFDSIRLGELNLRNRIILAPMTRSRANAHGVVNPTAAQYYATRAGAGLLITEGVNVGPMSSAFDHTPGLWTEAQVEAWKGVVDEVHRAGGRIVAQLWHGGRASARGLLNDREPLSPSGVNDDLDQLQVWALLANGAYVRIAATPSREMSVAEIENVVKEFSTAAANAERAGFDGVEIHAANGYLIHEFLSPTLNRREDRYGGSSEGRMTLLRDIVAGISEVMPLRRVGVRVSPFAEYNNVRDPDPAETYRSIVRWMNGLDLAYLHIADTNAWAGKSDLDKLLSLFRKAYAGSLILNGGIDPEQAKTLIETKGADAIAFGRLFLANPDLPERIQRSGPYNSPLRVGAYGGGDHGYLDYPTLGIAAGI